MPDLTKVKGRLNDVKRKLYYGATEPLKLLNINDVLLELDSGWHMPTTVVSNLAIGAEYWNLYITDIPDDINLDEYLTLASQIEINGERYTIVQYTKPRGLTKQWKIRLSSTGEHDEGFV